MEYLIHFLKGFVCIHVWGYSPERFLNLCSNHGIFMWNINKTEDGYTLYLHKKAFFALKPMMKKTGTRVKVLNRYGMPFLFPKLKRRWLFGAGFLVAFGFWLLSSHFIWSIEVEGNERITDDMIEDYLAEQGIRVSTPKKGLNIENIEQELRKHFDQITWDSLQLEGTRLTVYIKENEYYGMESQTAGKDEVFSEGADLVADMDGRVVSIITRAGEPKVKPGDIVEEGQILVSGTVPILGDDLEVKSLQYYIADADVIIEGVISFETSLDYAHIKKNYSGENKRVPFWQIGDYNFPVDFFGNKFLYADVITEKKQLTLMKGISFPIYYGYCQYFEYIPTECNYSEEEMKIQLMNSFYKFIENLQQKGVQINAKDVKIRRNGGKAFLKAEVAVWKKAEKKIGITRNGE